WDYFGRLTREGKTVLITTHLMDEAEKCQRVGYMRAGRMAAEGSPEEILRLAGLWPILKLWLAEPQKDAALLRAQGYEIEIVDDIVQVRLESHAQIKDILAVVSPLDMRLAEPRLEEAFLRLSEAA
ncbi:MAG: ABC transporter ATP-binding protein, partial [Methanothrix sp.]|nr:ABC transporter ATP-binding protein [Methanothrix sp.]